MPAVENAVERLESAGAAFDTSFERVISQGTRWLERHANELQSINRDIYSSERDLATPSGLPRRDWYRHSIYAPGFYTGYGVKTMPGIREAIEEGALEEAIQEAAIVAAAVDRMAQRVEKIVRDLNAM